MARFGEALVEATEVAQRWAMHDPDPSTRGQLDALIDAGDPALIRLFSGRISFGTAGLRAAVGPGPNHMNALVVRQTTVALVRWLQAGGAATPRIVIGFDARHDSQRFAEHTAAAVVAAGGVPLLANGHAPTPVFALAVLTEGADAGVVITASHNPPADNGFKLYLGDGIQLVAPADSEIAAEIDHVAAAWSQHGVVVDDVFADRLSSDCLNVDDWIANHRQAAVKALRTNARTIDAVHTSMHGVGGAPIAAAFEAAGFAVPTPVAAQHEPDPNFPTVQFPNPEEPGALDLAIDLANECGADVVLANDPDADRLAVAVRARAGSAFAPLSGNELGLLLADHMLRHTEGSNRVVSRSVVSTRQLDAMAAAAGVHCYVTLTGFKWIARPMLNPAHKFIFGFEEAIGYCVGDRVRDKDGITAALVAAEAIAGLGEQGKTVWDRFDELAIEHGVYASQPLTVRFDDDPIRVAALVAKITEQPPSALGDSPMTQSGPLGFGSLPPTSGLHLLAEDRSQVIVRPSGTEPKVKAYIEVVEPVAEDVTAARVTALDRLAAIVSQISTALT